MKNLILALILGTVGASGLFAGNQKIQEDNSQKASALTTITASILGNGGNEGDDDDDENNTSEGPEKGGGNQGSGSKIVCKCKKNWITANVCSVEGTGGICAYDVCILYDTNCR